MRLSLHALCLPVRVLQDVCHQEWRCRVLGEGQCEVLLVGGLQHVFGVGGVFGEGGGVEHVFGVGCGPAVLVVQGREQFLFIRPKYSYLYLYMYTVERTF